MKSCVAFSVLLYFALTRILTKCELITMAGVERNTMDETMGIGEFIHVCGGTLITESIVLTGCSCITERQLRTNFTDELPYEKVELLESDQIRVYAVGNSNIEGTNSQKQTVDALALSVHPLCEAKAYAYNFGLVKTVNAFSIDKVLELVLDISGFDQKMDLWKDGNCFTETWLPSSSDGGNLAITNVTNDLTPLENITYEWTEESRIADKESSSGESEQPSGEPEQEGESTVTTEASENNDTSTAAGDSPSALLDNYGIDNGDTNMLRKSQSNSRNFKRWESLKSYSNNRKSERMRREAEESSGEPVTTSSPDVEQQNSGQETPGESETSPEDGSGSGSGTGSGSGSDGEEPDILEPDFDKKPDGADSIVEHATPTLVKDLPVKFVIWTECADIMCAENAAMCDTGSHDTKRCLSSVGNERLCMADTGSPVYCEKSIVALLSSVNLACPETATKGVAVGIDGAFEYIKATLGMPDFQKEVPQVPRRTGAGRAPDFIRANTFLISFMFVISLTKIRDH